MYVATRGLYNMKPPTIIVPSCVKEKVEKLFEIHRQLDGSELEHNLIGLDVGETFDMGKGLMAKAFKTYHVIPSQGYVIYSVRKKLKAEYLGLPSKEIKNLKESGVEITGTKLVPEVAFTGDTMADFIVDQANADVMNAKVLIMETTFVNDSMTVEHAREHGHTHLSEVVALSDKFNNKGILFIHFSARHRVEEIQTAMKNLPKRLQERSHAFLEGW
ncbi:hypothetical protein KP509_03G062900 [Ceratopteris richardii]|nr:hypothetical protein KP509_03G062900 [Ceratopteris richardii]